jgi:hypothetical protein
LENNGEKCTLTKIQNVPVVSGTLTLTLRKKYNNSLISTKTLNITFTDDTIAEWDAGVC